MSGFIQGEDRSQATLFPERLDDYVAEDSAVRVIDVFIDELDLSGLGFKTESNDTGRPPYHPATMLKLFVYGYLNRVQSSHRLETGKQAFSNLLYSVYTSYLSMEQSHAVTTIPTNHLSPDHHLWRMLYSEFRRYGAGNINIS